MASITPTYNFSTYTSQIIGAWYRNDDPNAEIGSIVIDGTVVPKIGSFLVDNLDPVFYIFRWYESSNGVDRDSLIFFDYVEAKGETSYAIKLYHYKVDRGLTGGTIGTGNYYTDPVAGATEVVDERLSGTNFYISHRGTDFRERGTYWDADSTGWHLLGLETFVEGDEWTAIVSTQQAVASPGTGGGGGFGIKEISADDNFDTTYFSKNIVALGAANISLSFDDFSLIADFKARFNTLSFDGNYFTLLFTAGNSVHFLGEDVDRIALRPDSILELQKIGPNVYVTDYTGRIEEAGSFVFPADRILRGTLPANGQEYDIADFQDLIDRLPVSKQVDYATWDQTATYGGGNSGTVERTYYKNRARFAVDPIAGKFKVPDVRDYSFKALKYYDNTADANMFDNSVNAITPTRIERHQHELSFRADNPSAAFDIHTVPARVVEDFTVAVAGQTAIHVSNVVGESEGYQKAINQLVLVRI